jgi:hypothetical protein
LVSNKDSTLGVDGKGGWKLFARNVSVLISFVFDRGYGGKGKARTGLALAKRMEGQLARLD